MLDGHEDHQVEPAHGLAHAGHPWLRIEGVAIPMNGEIGEQVHGAPVEDRAFRGVPEGADRTIELKLEVLEAGRVLEDVARLLE
jgi:hypothetical protein